MLVVFLSNQKDYRENLKFHVLDVVSTRSGKRSKCGFAVWFEDLKYLLRFYIEE